MIILFKIDYVDNECPPFVFKGSRELRSDTKTSIVRSEEISLSNGDDGSDMIW